MVEVNSQYNVARPSSLPVRLAAKMRRRMFDRFMAFAHPAPTDLILDVGATSDRTYESSNYFEALYPHPSRIVAVGIDDAAFLESTFPGVRFVRADGLALPFADRSFDYVHSSAVIEHVGALANQEAFVRELARVARKGAFITTPSRWHPIEFHTVLPLIHWLPKGAHRRILRSIGHRELSEESNLNLLSERELLQVGRKVAGGAASVKHLHLGGFVSNLMLELKVGGCGC